MIAVAEPIDADVLRARNEFLTRSSLQRVGSSLAEILAIAERHAFVVSNELRGKACSSRTPATTVSVGSKEGVVTRSIVGALALVLGVAAAAAAQDARLARGAQVYAEQKCSLCHSIGDKGNKKGPLDEVGSARTLEELHAWIVDAKGMTAKTKAPRKPEMKNYDLPKADVDALVAYMGTLKKK